MFLTIVRIPGTGSTSGVTTSAGCGGWLAARVRSNIQIGSIMEVVVGTYEELLLGYKLQRDSEVRKRIKSSV